MIATMPARIVVPSRRAGFKHAVPARDLPGYSRTLSIDGHEVDRRDLVPWVAVLPDAILLRELRVA